MWDWFTYSLRVIALLSGLICIYVALFLYEDEHGKIQVVLEDMWLRISEQHHIALARHTVFMREVANVTDSVFDRLLGRSLLSLQSAGVSICYSMASIGLGHLLFVLFGDRVGMKYEGALPISHGTPRMMYFLFAVVFIGTFLSLGTLPMFTTKRLWLAVWTCLLSIFGFLWSVGLIYSFLMLINYGFASPPRLAFFYAEFTAMSIGVGAGILFDIGYIALTRWALRWQVQSTSFVKITVVVLVNCLLAFTLVIVPVWLSEKILYVLANYHIVGILYSGILFAAASNIITSLGTLLSIVLAILMLVHRICWPLLERPIFALQGLGIARRKKVFAASGIALIGVSLGHTPEVLKVIDKFSP